MTEAQLIHDGWFLWNAPTVYIGTQWSYEDTQAMRGQRIPILPVNFTHPLFKYYRPSEWKG